MEPPRELSSLLSLYEQLRNELELDPESLQVPPPPAPRFRPTFAYWMAGGFEGYISMASWTELRPTSTSQSTPGWPGCLCP